MGEIARDECGDDLLARAIREAMNEWDAAEELDVDLYRDTADFVADRLRDKACAECGLLPWDPFEETSPSCVICGRGL